MAALLQCDIAALIINGPVNLQQIATHPKSTTCDSGVFDFMESCTPRLLLSRRSHRNIETRPVARSSFGENPAAQGSRTVPQALKMDCARKVAFLESGVLDQGRKIIVGKQPFPPPNQERCGIHTGGWTVRSLHDPTPSRRPYRAQRDVGVCGSQQCSASWDSRSLLP